jgi:hypothetical protein
LAHRLGTRLAPATVAASSTTGTVAALVLAVAITLVAVASATLARITTLAFVLALALIPSCILTGVATLVLGAVARASRLLPAAPAAAVRVGARTVFSGASLLLAALTLTCILITCWLWSRPGIPYSRLSAYVVTYRGV